MAASSSRAVEELKAVLSEQKRDEVMTLKIISCNCVGGKLFSAASVVTQEMLSIFQDFPTEKSCTLAFEDVWDVPKLRALVEMNTDYIGEQEEEENLPEKKRKPNISNEEIEAFGHLEKYVFDLDYHSDCMKKVLTNRKDSRRMREMEAVKVLNVHLFNPLSGGKCLIDAHIAKEDICVCSCGCGTRIEKGPTGIEMPRNKKRKVNDDDEDKGSGVVRAGDALNEIKERLGVKLKHPKKLLATNFRKHTATIAQVLNLEDNELKWLCNHLGHTMRIHEQYYRQTSGLIERIDIAKLMIMKEHNLVGKFSGRKLSEIQFDSVESCWHGFVDMIVRGNQPVQVLQSTNPQEEVNMADEVKKDRHLFDLISSQSSSYSQGIAETITNSFAQVNKHPSLAGLPIPAFGCTSGQILVLAYDSQNDMLLKKMVDMNLFHEDVRAATIVMLWLYINSTIFMKRDITDTVTKPYLSEFKAEFCSSRSIVSCYKNAACGIVGFHHASNWPKLNYYSSAKMKTPSQS